MKVGEVKDFFRTHPDEENYWSCELCFVMVPIKGQKRDTLHLIDESLAVEYLPKGKIQRFRLVLATKPFDVMFLVHCPSVNLDNDWNATAEAACEQAKTRLCRSFKFQHMRDHCALFASGAASLARCRLSTSDPTR